MSSTCLLLHMNELNEQILGDIVGEDVVDAKIMHQCVVDKEHVEIPLERHHSMMEENHNNFFLQPYSYLKHNQ